MQFCVDNSRVCELRSTVSASALRASTCSPPVGRSKIARLVQVASGATAQAKRFTAGTDSGKSLQDLRNPTVAREKTPAENVSPGSPACCMSRGRESKRAKTCSALGGVGCARKLFERLSAWHTTLALRFNALEFAALSIGGASQCLHLM